MSGRKCGTYAGAIAHEKRGEPCCDPCIIARRRYNKQADYDRHRGMPRMVQLGHTAHQLIGVTPKDQMARATGLTVHKLCWLIKVGPDQMVRRATRDKILAAAGHPFWTPLGIQRRLRALHAIGWSGRAVAAHMDTQPTVLTRAISREGLHFIRRDFAERVIETYNELCMTPREGCGATRARNRAAKEGWAPPLDWDDIDHDPAPATNVASLAAIDPCVVERVLAGDPVPANLAERAEVARRWVEQGRVLADLARLTGWKVERYYRKGEAA